MDKVVDVLMKRDGLTKQEAEHQKSYVQDMMADAIAAGNYSEVEDIMASELGLEMDYIFDILGY